MASPTSTARSARGASATAELFLPDAAATDRAGAALGRALRPGDWVMLTGELGAGKSALARAAIRARLADAGREEEIPSPTFTLAQVYEAGGLTIMHADLYRLGDWEEAVELGLADAFETAAGFVEWPERLGPLAPERALAVEIELPPYDAEGRALRLVGVGGGWEDAIRAVAVAVGGAT